MISKFCFLYYSRLPFQFQVTCFQFFILLQNVLIAMALLKVEFTNAYFPALFSAPSEGASLAADSLQGKCIQTTPPLQPGAAGSALLRMWTRDVHSPDVRRPGKAAAGMLLDFPAWVIKDNVAFSRVSGDAVPGVQPPALR